MNDLVFAADKRSLSALADTEIVRLSETVRDMLAQHRPDDHGCCRQCSSWFRRRRHPCSVWTTAHQHLIGPASFGHERGNHRPLNTTRRKSVNYLPTDQYTCVTRDCPMSIDLHPVDDVVEIALGEYRIGGDTLRLVIDHPDTVLRLPETLHDARTKLINHLREVAADGGEHAT